MLKSHGKGEIKLENCQDWLGWHQPDYFKIFQEEFVSMTAYISTNQRQVQIKYMGEVRL